MSAALNDTDGILLRRSISQDDINSKVAIWLDYEKRFIRKNISDDIPYPVKGEKNYLITSALPYVNNVPHLGTIIGCVLSADVFARFCRLRGYNVLYICGTDEYGTATETKAIEEKLTPRQVCDKYFQIHRDVYQWFNIKFDHFGRTTTQKQTEIAQDMFLKLHKNGYTTTAMVDQLYCKSCQRFLADRFVEGTCPLCAYIDARGDQCDKCGRLINAVDLKEPRCKLCSSQPELRSSEHIFLNLTKLEPILSEHLENQWNNPDCKWTSNAISIAKSWLKDGLKERCITRDLKWGTPVPLPGFENKVFYVWFDAPIGYISITADYMTKWETWWKNRKEVEFFNFVGKDNVPFHSVIFPACQLGTGDPFTVLNHISATEYLNYEDSKFSKSRGVGVFGNDAKETGIPADIWRFYLLSQRPESHDANFNWSDFALKVNGDLLNNLGNFINRALSFVQKFFNNTVPDVSLTDVDKIFIAEVALELEDYVDTLEKIKLRDGCRIILNVSRLGNHYIQNRQPWVLVKKGSEGLIEGGTVVALTTNVVALLAIMLQPYLPDISTAIQSQLNIDLTKECGISQSFVRLIPSGHKIGEVKPLFQKLETSAMEEFRVRFAGVRSKEPTPAATPPATVDSDLENAVKEQGDKVRQLKASKAEKAVIDAEVKKLLELKQRLAKGSTNKNVKPKSLPAASTASIKQMAKVVANGNIDSDSLIDDRLAALEAKLAAANQEVAKNEEARLRQENKYLRNEVTTLLNRLNELEKLRGVNHVPVPNVRQPDPTPTPGAVVSPVVKSTEAKIAKDSKPAVTEKKAKPSTDKASSTKAAGDSESEPDVSRLDMRVGRILSAKKHPDADGLYVEDVDVGEEKPRTVVSGLVKFVPLEEMQNRLCVFLCNLKPAKMRGVESCAMLMCASTPEKVEILNPPSNSVPGERIVCQNYEGTPDAQLNPKKKIFEQVQPNLRVDANGNATYKDSKWEIAGKGVVKAPSLRNVPIK